MPPPIASLDPLTPLSSSPPLSILSPSLSSPPVLTPTPSPTLPPCSPPQVRLQIIQLAALLLEAAPPPALTRFAPDLAAVLCRGLEDGFPDIKKVGGGRVVRAEGRRGCGGWGGWGRGGGEMGWVVRSG